MSRYTCRLRSACARRVSMDRLVHLAELVAERLGKYEGFLRLRRFSTHIKKGRRVTTPPLSVSLTTRRLTLPLERPDIRQRTRLLREVVRDRRPARRVDSRARRLQREVSARRVRQHRIRRHRRPIP